MKKVVCGILAAALITGTIGFFIGISSTYVTGKVVNVYKLDDKWYSVIDVQGEQVIIEKYKEVNSEVKLFLF